MVKDNFCRGCHAGCPVHIDVEDGRTVSLRPIKEHPVFHGYACAKGRASVEFSYLEGRLLHSRKRQPDGSHQPIASAQAITEVAEKIRQTIERHGSRSVALYSGTPGNTGVTPLVFAEAFMAAIGSPMMFSSLQIDQPGKLIAPALHGIWLAGHATLEQADAWLVIGTNPAISMQMPANPAHVISRAKKRGCRIYVIDPRRTEMASHADIFLQPLPGQDAAILAALIHIVLSENLQDQAFLDQNVKGLETLRQAVSGFTPQFVAERSGVSAAQLQALARGYAASKCGIAFAGTGPNMAPHGTLMEYLRLCLMTICGHWRRAGDEPSARNALVHPLPAIAQAVDPMPAWDLGEKLRSRNLTNTLNGMPTSALAEEILLEGEGRVRVLIVNGGNPVAAWPDQARTMAAMKKLDLLVCLEPVMSDTAKFADYVIAPRVQYETVNTSAILESAPGAGYAVYQPLQPYAAYFDAVVDPPPGADVINEWEFYYGLARHMGLPLTIKPLSFAFNPAEARKRAVRLDMRRKPTSEEVWEMLLDGSPVPLAEVKAHPMGKIFDLPEARVMPKAGGWSGKLDAGNADMMEDLQRVHHEPRLEKREYTHRLIVRRLKDRYNSGWHGHQVSTRQWPRNPAFIHPDDMVALRLEEGDIVDIRSRRGAVKGMATADRTLLPGVIAMAHGWADMPRTDGAASGIGAYTNMLIDTTVECDPYSALPRMSDIPVNIRKFSNGGDRPEV